MADGTRLKELSTKLDTLLIVFEQQNAHMDEHFKLLEQSLPSMTTVLGNNPPSFSVIIETQTTDNPLGGVPTRHAGSYKVR